MIANIAVLVKGVKDVFLLDIDLATMTNDELIDKVKSLASKSLPGSRRMRYFIINKYGDPIWGTGILYNLGIRQGDLVFVLYDSTDSMGFAPPDYSSEITELKNHFLLKVKNDCEELVQLKKAYLEQDARSVQMRKRMSMLEEEYAKSKKQLEEMRYRNMENERELMSLRESKPYSYEPAHKAKEDTASSLSVNASLYAPSQIKKGSWEKIQVFLYKDDEFGEVEKKASSVDPNAKIMSYNPLDMFLNIGDAVDVAIRMYDDDVRMPQTTSRIIWQGYYKSCEFLFQVPKESKLESIAGEAEISVNNIQIGKLVFNSDVVEGHPVMLYANAIAKAYKKVFISYSHKDKKKAEVFAKLCKAQGQEFFFDRETLIPGDYFDSEIEKFIQSADLFILCWSRHAYRSKYVKKEYTYALEFSELKKRPEEASLKISPFSISPRKKPPVELAMLHFEEIEI